MKITSYEMTVTNCVHFQTMAREHAEDAMYWAAKRGKRCHRSAVLSQRCASANHYQAWIRLAQLIGVAP